MKFFVACCLPFSANQQISKSAIDFFLSVEKAVILKLLRCSLMQFNSLSVHLLIAYSFTERVSITKSMKRATVTKVLPSKSRGATNPRSSRAARNQRADRRSLRRTLLAAPPLRLLPYRDAITGRFERRVGPPSVAAATSAAVAPVAAVPAAVVAAVSTSPSVSYFVFCHDVYSFYL